MQTVTGAGGEWSSTGFQYCCDVVSPQGVFYKPKFLLSWCEGRVHHGIFPLSISILIRLSYYLGIWGLQGVPCEGKKKNYTCISLYIFFVWNKQKFESPGGQRAPRLSGNTAARELHLVLINQPNYPNEESWVPLLRALLVYRERRANNREQWQLLGWGWAKGWRTMGDASHRCHFRRAAGRFCIIPGCFSRSELKAVPFLALY